MSQRSLFRVVPGTGTKSLQGLVPPHNLDAEAAVLSAMFLSPDTVVQIRALLEAGDFYSAANQIVYTAVCDLDQKKQVIDVVTVAAWLRKREQLTVVGGASYLAQLIDATPAVHNVVEHARLVAECSWARQAIEICHRRAAEGYGDVGQITDWVDSLTTEVSRLAERSRFGSASDMQESARAAMARLEEAQTPNYGVKTGLAQLDAITGGILPGEVTLVTAPTGTGKTAFATNVALNVAAGNHGVLIYSLEQPQAELTLRMATTAGRLDAYHVLKNPTEMSDGGRQSLICTMRWLAKLPIRIDSRKNLTVASIRAGAKQVKAEMVTQGIELRLLVVDYAQLINWRTDVGPKGTKYEGLDEVGKQLCLLAEEVNCQIWLIAQLNHNGGIRDCPLLEMHSQNWLDIKREKASKTDEPVAVEIVVRKQRNGSALVKAHCWWHGRHLLFSDDDYVEPSV